MRINEPPDPRSSLWNLIAYYLRFLRMQRGESGHTLAMLLNCARSSVSRLENGEARLTPEQADKLDAAWRTGGLFGVLVYYATLGHDPDWFKAHLELEARARVLRIYELGFVPGLLQTERYARALFNAWGVRDVEKQLTQRMERQVAVFDRPEPPMTWVLLAEPVLEWQIGGPEVMREQLAHLLEISEHPNVVIRVVPKIEGAHPGLGGAFKIMTVGGADLVYTEAMGGGRLVQGALETGRFVDWWDRIGARALPEGSTRLLVRRKMEAFQDGSVA
ncbi:helix-turn-helix transcriptional regulator [Actinomadura kijaniata]|uniref:Transcriptional regulator with XRE-family HTH domain n=1 Tax=Actinomadura namibiensis TaxID=182080 RepID=A0A7W3LMZ4_ACTNM|nr:helix-turn-helix transcriptional regulator [Actinomadura namibiensis]MBA8951067.1 transcriptional regulator with XRE-family HTH domain [Actinomadura namibiensis]